MTRELGLSCLFVHTADANAIIAYVSESITEILGYEQHDLYGKSAYLIFHPDEVSTLREIHYHGVLHEKVGSITYMRLLHHGGFYVDCAVASNTVFDLAVGVVTRAINGPNMIRLAATAREIIEARTGLDGVRMRRWTSDGRHTPTSTEVALPDYRPWEEPEWERPDPKLRTFFILDRFTETVRIMFSSNDFIVNSSECKGLSFYSIVRPQDRPRVRQWIEAAKTWTPVVFDEQRSGYHGFLTFDVLKIPERPPAGRHFPVGSEESERDKPGQKLMAVEGIFVASSDGLICVIAPVQQA